MFVHVEVAPGVVTVWWYGGYPVAYVGMGFGRRALRYRRWLSCISW
jgi:hypothetical protein